MLRTLFTMHDIPSRKMCVVSVLKYIQYTCVSTTCIYACTCLHITFYLLVRIKPEFFSNIVQCIVSKRVGSNPT